MVSSDPARKPVRRRSGRQRFLRRLAAVAFGILPIALIELVLRLFVPAPAIELEDPYVSFSEQSPLFVLDDAGSRFETDRKRLAAFRPQSFAEEKTGETYRIFCLGGSTVQGRPYAVETSFTTWLALNLRAARPDMHFEVVNCGGISYASYRLVPIMRELLDHAPDLFIIYTGHNEFLEDRTYGRLKNMPRALSRIHLLMLNLRTYAIPYCLLFSRRAPQTEAGHLARNVLQPEVQAKLDYREGLASYHRDDVWRQGTIVHFRRNLEKMVFMARRAGVPVILMNPVSNLKDCPPFKSEPGSDLPESRLQRFDELLKMAGNLDRTDTYGKIRLLEEAAGIDSRNAGNLYQLGRCYARLGRFTEAKKWFVLAKEEDVCPLRILEPMHEAILDVASIHDVPLVDVKALFEDRIEDGISGNEWLLDHVHPSIEGHQRIADELYRILVDLKFVNPEAPEAIEGWKAARDVLWQQNFSSLNNAYYAHGAARLERLLKWCRGTE